MKLIKAEVDNFGSYRHLEFNYSEQGLALVYGATGSGKSTIMDIAPWVLFGKTAKDGSADEVRNWSNLKEPTKGTVYVELNDGSTISVTRSRNATSDLRIDGDCRGRDIKDTQRIINERLGCDGTLFLIGSYYCESSPGARFFEAAARDRRVLLERCTDLRLPAILGERCSEARKDCRKSSDDLSSRLSTLLGAFEQTSKLSERLLSQSTDWERKQSQLIESLDHKSRKFEEEKRKEIEETALQVEAILRKIEAIKLPEENNCPACGAENVKYRTAVRSREHQEYMLRDAQEKLSRLKASSNPYPEQIKRERNKINPHIASQADLGAELSSLESQILTIDSQLESSRSRIASLDSLTDFSSKLRGVLLGNAMREVEVETNRILEEYFSGAFRVGFTMNDEDLEVEITKNGHACSFRQLSKGQRQILRLSFSVALMKRVSAQSGVQFDNLFLDEPADGGDSSVKAAAFRLFQELSIGRDSVLVIDHSPEFQNLFDKKLSVQLNGDYSEVRDEA